MAKYLLLFKFTLLVTMIAAYDFELFGESEIAKTHGRPTFYGTHWWDRKDGRSSDYAPFMASIHGPGQSHCSGAIVDKQHVITTATCCFSTIKYSGYITIGSVNHGGVHLSYDTYYHPPDYDEVTKKSDICVIRLERPLKRVRPIKLPLRPLRPSNAATVYYFAKQLKMLHIYNFDKRKCQRYFPYGSFNDEMLCAGAKDHSKGACDVKQGGPLIAHGVLHGLASWSLECTPNTERDPIVFTNIWAYLNFIKSVLAMNP